jgi:hypothetical protein
MKLTWLRVEWKEVSADITRLMTLANFVLLADMESFAMAGPSHESMGEDKGRHRSIFIIGCRPSLRQLNNNFPN